MTFESRKYGSVPRSANGKELTAPVLGDSDGSAEELSAGDLSLVYLSQFYADDRVQWFLFTRRFSAAIFTYEKVVDAAAEEIDSLHEQMINPPDSIEWPIDELESFFFEDAGFFKDAARIAGSAAIVAATAALELLLVELADERASSLRPANGLFGKLKRLLDSVGCSPSDSESIRRMARPVADRRNAIAHALDGSDWAPKDERPDLSAQGIEQGFSDVGRLADAIIRVSRAIEAGSKIPGASTSTVRGSSSTEVQAEE